jgi:hypothetical protein
VRYKNSCGKWRKAKGTDTWNFKAKLKPGRNTIQVAAYDSRNVASAILSVKVKRR